MLAGVGLDAVIRDAERRRAARWAVGAFAAIGVALGLIWLFGRGTLSPHDASVRAQSFVWPAASTGMGLAAFGILVMIGRRSTHKQRHHPVPLWVTLGAVSLVLTFQTAYLVADDAPIFPSASAPFQPKPGVVALQRATSSSLVGLGLKSRAFGGLGLGFGPNTNMLFGIREFAEYDPIAPLSFFNSWQATNKTSSGLMAFYDFTPAITSATVARRYGVSYVLERRGAAGPTGSVFDAQVGKEDLYRIPGAATATLVAPAPSGKWPSIDAPGSAVPVKWLSPSEVRIVTNSSSAQVLRLRLDSFPGWHATIDGKSLPLAHFLSMMFQANVPAGRHTIELSYWPNDFTDGIVLASGAVVALVAAALVTRRRDRRVTTNEGTSST